MFDSQAVPRTNDVRVNCSAHATTTPHTHTNASTTTTCGAIFWLDHPTVTAAPHSMMVLPVVIFIDDSFEGGDAA